MRIHLWLFFFQLSHFRRVLLRPHERKRLRLELESPRDHPVRQLHFPLLFHLQKSQLLFFRVERGITPHRTPLLSHPLPLLSLL